MSNGRNALCAAVCAAAVLWAPATGLADADEGESGESEESLEELLDDLDDEVERRERPGDGGEEQTQQRQDLVLEELSIEEARAYGFEFGDERRRQAGGAAPLAALTAGVPLHGAGHLVAGDPQTGWWLAGSEAVGAGLLATGIIGANNSAGGWSFGVSRMVGVIGAGVLGAGYLADVAGTLPTEGTGLPRNDAVRRGFSAQAGYLFRRSQSSPLSHFAHARVGYDGGWWSAELSTEQELQLSASSGTLRAALHPEWARSSLTHPTLVLAGEYLVRRGDGQFRRWSGRALAGGNVDLEVMSVGLRQFAVGGLVGLERSWLMIGGAAEGSWLPAAEVFTHFNVSQRLHTRVGYRIGANDWLAADGNLAGIGELDLLFDTDGALDLRLGGRLGGGVAVVTGLRYEL